MRKPGMVNSFTSSCTGNRFRGWKGSGKSPAGLGLGLGVRVCSAGTKWPS